jgi:hypothetical protein
MPEALDSGNAEKSSEEAALMFTLLVFLLELTYEVWHENCPHAFGSLKPSKQKKWELHGGCRQGFLGWNYKTIQRCSSRG